MARLLAVALGVPDLPLELWAEIGARATAEDLAHLTATCRALCRLRGVGGDAAWRAAIERDFAPAPATLAECAWDPRAVYRSWMHVYQTERRAARLMCDPPCPGFANVVLSARPAVLRYARHRLIRRPTDVMFDPTGVTFATPPTAGAQHCRPDMYLYLLACSGYRRDKAELLRRIVRYRPLRDRWWTDEMRELALCVAYQTGQDDIIAELVSAGATLRARGPLIDDWKEIARGVARPWKLGFIGALGLSELAFSPVERPSELALDTRNRGALSDITSAVFGVILGAALEAGRRDIVEALTRANFSRLEFAFAQWSPLTTWRQSLNSAQYDERADEITLLTKLGLLSPDNPRRLVVDERANLAFGEWRMASSAAALVYELDRTRGLTKIPKRRLSDFLSADFISPRLLEFVMAQLRIESAAFLANYRIAKFPPPPRCLIGCDPQPGDRPHITTPTNAGRHTAER